MTSRLDWRIGVQLTTDGHNVYLTAVESAFGWNGVDYAQLVKLYGQPTGGGIPTKGPCQQSYIERANLSIRMHSRRFTRLTNGFSKRVDNHAHAVALHFFVANYCRRT